MVAFVVFLVVFGGGEMERRWVLRGESDCFVAVLIGRGWERRMGFGFGGVVGFVGIGLI